MKETRDIIAAYHKATQLGKRTALATVVHVEGSSYRRPGARMLMTEDGELTGAISGGCLEGDALRKALLAINQQQNKLVTYNSMDDEDNTIGIQLGCNGIVHILFEPVDAAKDNNPVNLLEKLFTLEKLPGINNNAVLVTLFSLDSTKPQPGTLLMATGWCYCGDIHVVSTIEKEIAMVLNNEASIINEYTFSTYGTVSCFIELVKPPVELVIAGAGNDVFPLVQMADGLGWDITIADGRKTHANRQRFPSVKKILVGKPADTTQQVNINRQTAFVLMSHNYNYDLAMLKELIHTNCNYIGVLGPKKKLQKMLEELGQQGIDTSNPEKIYGPTGLDIGAETAEEIALSIMAEIKAVLSNKNAATLRNKNGFIHEHHVTAAKS